MTKLTNYHDVTRFFWHLAKALFIDLSVQGNPEGIVKQEDSTEVPLTKGVTIKFFLTFTLRRGYAFLMRPFSIDYCGANHTRGTQEIDVFRPSYIVARCL